MAARTPLVSLPPAAADGSTSPRQRRALLVLGSVLLGCAAFAAIGRIALRDAPPAAATVRGAAAAAQLAAAEDAGYILPTEVPMAPLETKGECIDTDDVMIYKYTIATSTAADDGKWADELLGCTFMNVTDTHGCVELGKTSCLSPALDFGLHFVSNERTHAGPMKVSDWDNYMRTEQSNAFAMNRYSSFMHYHLAFYVPDLTQHVSFMLANDRSFLLRKGYGYDGVMWFTIVIGSPSSKTFEISATNLSTSVYPHETIMQWNHRTECPMTHFSTTYSADELHTWYRNFTQSETGPNGSSVPAITDLSLPDAMPVRSSIAVPDLEAAGKWWSQNVPALTLEAATAHDEPCGMVTMRVKTYTAPGFKHEVRLVQNDAAHHGEKSLADFVSYINMVNANYTWGGGGWSAWYDRHLGLQFQNCALDDYMLKFEKKGISFHPHGRDGTTKNTGEPTDHTWTEGIQGYGIEMQGNFSYAYKDCYSVFEWCTATTDPIHDVCDESRR